MRLAILLVVLIGMIPTWANHEQAGRRYQQIALVDKRVVNEEDYRFYVIEYDTEGEVAYACGAPRWSFTARGCMFEYRAEDGRIIYKVIVLSNDYVALRHELNHIIFGPCHIDAAGPTPIGCQEWLIKNNLEPIGNQKITINQTKEEK